MIKTEYLITIDCKKNIATDTTSFNNLLMSNPKIKIHNSKITYESETFTYKLQQNNITDTDYICYHITIESSVNDFDLHDNHIIKYQDLLRAIRCILPNDKNEIETLWDDISFYCSRKAYPIIYEIENLMRKLLTKFMLINVGTKWEKENIPSKISTIRNNNKEKQYGLLYGLDFKDLSTFLFESYALNNNIIDLKKEVESNESISSESLKNYIPHSNWERYFNNIVAVENEHFIKSWEKLYELRCKIAHNNKFTPSDLSMVNSIVADLKPYIEKALNELDTIKIDATEKEFVSETFARTNDAQLGSFIIEYNNLNRILFEKYMKHFPQSKTTRRTTFLSSKNLLHYLLENEFIDNTTYKELLLITMVRNSIVHQTTRMSNEEIETYLEKIKYYVSYFNNKTNHEE